MATEEGGQGYWARWQVPVCALIFVAPAATAIAVICRAKRDHRPRTTDLWAPCWRSAHPALLLGYRAGVFVVMTVVLSLTARWSGWQSFYFYTQWTFTLVIIYFALGTFISAHGCWSYSRQFPVITEERNELLKGDLEETPSNSTDSLANNTSALTSLQRYQKLDGDEQRTRFLGNLMQIIYQTSAGAVILTDIVFWGLIVPFLSDEHFSLDPLMGCMHTLNFVFLLIDTALNSLPFPFFRMAYFVLWSCAYVIFQWVLHACGFSWWPYPFLELATPWAPLWYFCMALIHIPCYGSYALIVKMKNSLFLKLFPHAYIRSY